MRSQASTNCSSAAAVEIRMQSGAPNPEPATVATKASTSNQGTRIQQRNLSIKSKLNSRNGIFQLNRN